MRSAKWKACLEELIADNPGISLGGLGLGRQQLKSFAKSFQSNR